MSVHRVHERKLAEGWVRQQYELLRAIPSGTPAAAQVEFARICTEEILDAIRRLREPKEPNDAK